MKRFAILVGGLALFAPLTWSQTSTWVSDPNHSEVDFSISHLSVSKVHGRFGQVKATILYNEADVTKSTVTATIGVDTVNTGVDARDNHLKSADFFNVAEMQKATFVSTSVAKNGDKLAVSGNLTLHGVTKPVVLRWTVRQSRLRTRKVASIRAFRPPPPSIAPHSASDPSLGLPWLAAKSTSILSWKLSSSKQNRSMQHRVNLLPGRRVIAQQDVLNKFGAGTIDIRGNGPWQI